MPAVEVIRLLSALEARGVSACVSGGWAVDALLERQTRTHTDLDLWVDARDLEALFQAFVALGVDQVYPWPGDRPWNFVLHDGDTRRVDLHLYEEVGDGRVHYGSVLEPFVFSTSDVAGQGEIGRVPVRCESPEFSVRCHSGYPSRSEDRHDVGLLCAQFGIALPPQF